MWTCTCGHVSCCTFANRSAEKVVYFPNLSLWGISSLRGGVGGPLCFSTLEDRHRRFFPAWVCNVSQSADSVVALPPTPLSWSLGGLHSLLGLRPQLDKIQKGLLSVSFSISHSAGFQQAPPPAPVARQIPLLLGHHCFFATKRGTNY